MIESWKQSVLVAATVLMALAIGVGLQAWSLKGTPEEAPPYTTATATSSAGVAAVPASCPAQSSTDSDVRISVDEAAYHLKVASMEPELAHEFGSLSEIANASPNIVIVTIESRADEPFSNIPFSVASARIEEVVRGSLARGQLIPVVETGGLFAGQSKMNPGEVGQPTEVGLEGVPVMKPGERWLLFLTGQTHVGPRQDAYAVSGAMQGKLLIGSDNRIAFTGDPSRLQGAEFAVPAAARGRTLNWLLAQISESLPSNVSH